MSELLKRYFVPFNLFILTIGIFFVTQLVTFKIARVIEPPHKVGHSVTTVDAGKKEIKPFDVYKIILDRNIFKSKTLSELLSPPSSIGPIKEEKPLVPIKLIGTVAGTAEYSYAVIEDPFQKTNKIFKLNDTVSPGIRLLEIHRNKIVISRDGEKEEIELGTPEAGAPTRTAGPPRPVTPPSESPEGELSPQTSFVVDRESVEAATEDMNRLLTQARLVPNFSAGVADGFRIFSIVPSSLFEKVGLRNGDIIHNINGVELKDPEKAFQVYQLLKDSDRFVVDLIRAGQKMTLNYEIR